MIFIFGISGACRREEIAHITIEDIEDLSSAILIKIPENKTNRPRSFTVTGDYVDIYRKYAALRPDGVSDKRFFLSFRNGKCTRQVVGLQKIGVIPKEIARYLKLPNAEQYTGHCFRRTSATLLVDAGAGLTALKRHGGWKSSSVAESYIDDSIVNKIEVANKILNTNTSHSHTVTNSSLDTGKVDSHTMNTNTITSHAVTATNTSLITESTDAVHTINTNSVIFQNCTNCTFNIGK